MPAGLGWTRHRFYKATQVGSIPTAGTKYDGDCSSIGRAPDCDAGRCGFDSHQSPKHGDVAQ